MASGITDSNKIAIPVGYYDPGTYVEDIAQGLIGTKSVDIVNGKRKSCGCITHEYLKNKVLECQLT